MVRSTLVEDNLHLADRVARSTPRPTHMDLDDYIQDARLGLIEAAGKFDPELGWKFGTYASPLMRGRVLDGLRDMDHLSRSHRKAVKDGNKTDWVNESLEKLLDRTKATFTGDTPAEVTPSFVRYEEEGFRGVEDRMWWEWLRSLTRKLHPRCRQATELYFFEGLTLAEVGGRMGVNESRACQLTRKGALTLAHLVREAEALDDAA